MNNQSITQRPAPRPVGADNTTRIDGRGEVTDSSTMTVRVRDRASEKPWGVGFTDPCVRTVTISAACPKCGGERGEPRNLNQAEDGAYYSVDIWTNPCGHVDYYGDVVKEADALEAAKAGADS